MSEAFLRAEMLLGPEAMSVLSGAHVAVLGLGGVGSWCAEALARTGVGALTLADHDTVGLSNLNRQAEALHSTLDQPKAQAMAARVRDINPACRVTPLSFLYSAESREEFFAGQFDYIVDAIDLVSCKLDLIQTALERQIPILSALGTGNKLDASLLRVSDIEKTEGCPQRAAPTGHPSPQGSLVPRGGPQDGSAGIPTPRPPQRPRQRSVGPRHRRTAAGQRGSPGPDRRPVTAAFFLCWE